MSKPHAYFFLQRLFAAWVLLVAVMVAAIGLLVARRSRRRRSWEAELAEATAETAWFARELLPDLRRATSADELAGIWQQPRESTTRPGGQRDLLLEGQLWPATLYERDSLRAGAAFAGPAVVEQYDSTVLIPPGFTAAVDPFGNLVGELER